MIPSPKPRKRPPLADLTNLPAYRPKALYFPHPQDLKPKAKKGKAKKEIPPVPPEDKVDKTKYKTEMCKNWIEVGFCRYGGKCQFAHGGHELLGKPPPLNNQKYKSKTCSTFTEALFCPYGQRCLFRHEDRTFDQLKHYFYVHLLTLRGAAAREFPRKRLQVFTKITKDCIDLSSQPSQMTTTVTSEIAEQCFTEEEDRNFSNFLN